MVEYKALKATRTTAAIEEDNDLLTYSALIIAYLLAQYPDGALAAKAACHLDLAIRGKADPHQCQLGCADL